MNKILLFSALAMALGFSHAQAQAQQECVLHATMTSGQAASSGVILCFSGMGQPPLLGPIRMIFKNLATGSITSRKIEGVTVTDSISDIFGSYSLAPNGHSKLWTAESRDGKKIELRFDRPLNIPGPTEVLILPVEGTYAIDNRVAWVDPAPPMPVPTPSPSPNPPPQVDPTIPPSTQPTIRIPDSHEKSRPPEGSGRPEHKR